MRYMTKYHSVKVRTPAGQVFDSKRELARYTDLKLLEAAGRISGLRRQVKYELIPAQKDLKTGKVIERPVTYKADFVYTDVSTGREIVEDAKGVRTKEYVIKRKLMLYNKGIQVREV